MSEDVTQTEMMTNAAAEQWVSEDEARRWDDKKLTLYVGAMFIRAASLAEAVTTYIRHQNAKVT